MTISIHFTAQGHCMSATGTAEQIVMAKKYAHHHGVTAF